MNEIVNKILIAVGKFIPEIRLRQPEFTYSSCGLYIYRHELDKACF